MCTTWTLCMIQDCLNVVHGIRDISAYPLTVWQLRIYSILYFPEGGAFENNLALFVRLRTFEGKLVLPTKMSAAALARNIIDEVSASDHHSKIDCTESDVVNLVEEPRWTRRTDKVCRVTLFNARQRSSTPSTLEQPWSRNVSQEHTTHRFKLAGR